MFNKINPRHYSPPAHIVKYFKYVKYRQERGKRGHLSSIVFVFHNNIFVFKLMTHFQTNLSSFFQKNLDEHPFPQ